MLMAKEQTGDMKLLYFDDQVDDLQGSLRQLYKIAKSKPLLSSLLQALTEALQDEVAGLPAAEKLLLPTFTTLLDLAAVADGNVILLTVLLNVMQLGRLHFLAESDPKVLHDSQHKTVFGQSVGLLSGCAAAVCTSVVDLLAVSPEIVRVSLRLALASHSRLFAIEQAPRCQSLRVVKTSRDVVNKAIHSYHNSLGNIPKYKQTAIVQSSAFSHIISGPKKILEGLQQHLRELGMDETDTTSLCGSHCAPFVAPPALDGIIGRSPCLDSRSSMVTQMISSSSGDPRRGNTLRELLDSILPDILQRGTNCQTVNESVKNIVGEAPAFLLNFGSTCSSADHEICNGLSNIMIQNAYNESAPTLLQEAEGVEDIAIVGLAGRFPGSEDLDDFWNVLREGRDLCQEVPFNRFDIKSHCDPSGKTKNSTLSAFGCFVERPGMFDISLFKMSPEEALQLDPMQRLLLTVTYEALEMAGYNYDRTRSTHHSRIGTFIGQTCDDYRQNNSCQDIDHFFATGGNRAFGPGRVSHHFGWEGPSFSIDAACSSSMAALDLACSALQQRRCDTAVVGGANIMTASDIWAGLSRAMFLSPTGPCKTFDQKADGYCRGDGVGIVVVKRLKDALSDNDNIQAVIKGISTNHCGESTAIMRPHMGTQQRLFQRVLQNAGALPNEISYVECHGTGTQAGDIVESRSVTGVFAKDREADAPLFLGSIKANIGHSEAAAGVSSLIKTVLMLQKGMIPPHIGVKSQLNRKLPPFASLNVKLANHEMPLQSIGRQEKKSIFINNFNAAGGNTCLLLEGPPARLAKRQVGHQFREAHVVTVSAATALSLKQNIERLIFYLEANSITDLANLSYSTTARRMHHRLRRAYSCSTTTELLTLLKDSCESIHEHNVPFSEPSTMFAFTGHGSQYAGMGKGFFESLPTFRDALVSLDSICLLQGFPHILEIIEGSDEAYSRSSFVQRQLSLSCLQLALALTWRSWGLEPRVVIGHSLGEYAALCVAGVLSTYDMIYLVGQRATLIERNCRPDTHAMLVVKLDAKSLESIIRRAGLPTCEISCMNGRRTTVVSGEKQELHGLAGLLLEAKIKSTPIKVEYAFHSSQMDKILDDYRSIASTVEFHKPQIPVASTLLGRTIAEGGVFDADYICNQARKQVSFMQAVDACHNEGVIGDSTQYLEIGPNVQCLSMIRSILGVTVDRTLPCMNSKEDNWTTVAASIAKAYSNGTNIAWSEYQRPFEDHLSLLDLPTYAFDEKEYWMPYRGEWALTKAYGSQGPASVVQGSSMNGHSEEQANTRGNHLPAPPPARSNIPTEISVSGSHYFESLLSAISRETNVDSSHLEDDQELSDIGVDSMSMMTILASFRLEHGLDLPATIFTQYPSIGALENHFRTTYGLGVESNHGLKDGAEPTTNSFHTGISNGAALTSLKSDPISRSPSRNMSVLIQDSSAAMPPTLFLLPDSSGLASAYLGMQFHSVDVKIIGLNSPFAKDFKQYTQSIEAISSMFLSEIESFRPTGPVLLGGWSVGGAYAFEIATQLLAKGKSVAGFIFIDAPCPGMPLYTSETVSIIAKTGVFDEVREGLRDQLLGHFQRSMFAFNDYDPSSLRSSLTPLKTWIIWADTGFAQSSYGKNHEDLLGMITVDNKLQKWMMGPRALYGPHGWDKLLPRVECKVVQGDHWSIMRAPIVKDLSTLVIDAFQDILSEYNHDRRRQLETR